MSDTHDKGALVRTTGRMHPMVEAAMAHSPDPETLRGLLDVQREWERGEAKKAFTRALVELKRDLPTVLARDKTVDFTSAKGRTLYTHTSLASVMDAVTVPLTQHGFSLSWKSETKDRLVSVTCRLQHAEGHSDESSLQSPPDTSGNKGGAQAIASTITLLQRYTALSLLGIATDDMKEPHEPKPPTEAEAVRVNQAKNLEAAARLKNYGKTRAQAEAYLGVAVADWTAADLGKLSEWVRPPGAVAPEDEPPVREPGEEG